MAEYHGTSIHKVRHTISFWDRLFGRAEWIEEVNIRNAFIENQEEDLELLRKAVNDMQPEKQLAVEAKHLDNIGILKERITSLEGQLRTSQGNALNLRRESENAQRLLEIERRGKTPPAIMQEGVLIKPERAMELGRGRSYAEPNSGAHSVSGQVGSSHADNSTGLLMAAAILVSGDTERSSESSAHSPAPVEQSRSEAACSGFIAAYSTPEQRSEPAYTAPPSRPTVTAAVLQAMAVVAVVVATNG